MKNTAAAHHSSSFRDPAGFVFTHKNALYRQINQAGRADFDQLIESGLYQSLSDKKLLVKHKEIKSVSRLPADADRYKIIQPELILFNSYPYEWSFSQLKSAAALTLKIQKIALSHGMILKDASAYNVQFIGKRPVFIDTLSFRAYQSGDTWDGYKQFCEHFVAPLALASYSSLEVLKLLRIYLDGLPLRLVVRLLPARAKFRRGLTTHLYLHAASQRRYQSEKSSAPAQPKMKRIALEGLLSSLSRTIDGLRPPREHTQWAAYYEQTTYSDVAFADKRKKVSLLLKRIKDPRIIWDLGANDGTFSRLAASTGAYTVAFDIDPLAVDHNFQDQANKQSSEKILPMVQDLTNPSPGLGWAHSERASLVSRGPADGALALALIHHLAIGNNLPFGDIAAFMIQICQDLIIEFIPKDDSKVQFLLRGRNNIFDHYDEEHFEKAFARHFELIDKQTIEDSHRKLYLFRAKA